MEADVAIVGAGPAGLAAAAELRKRGVARVVVLDREPELGGIPRHCGHHAFGVREFGRLLTGPDYARRLAARARAAGAEIRTGTTVLRVEGPTLALSTAQGLASLTAARVLLATGVRETPRAARLVGGTRAAGILTTGSLQSMVYLYGRRPFARPVIVGTELVSFSALLTCRHAGIRPVAMVEANARTTARRPAAGLAALMRVPLLTRTSVVRIDGGDRVEAVVLRAPDGERTLACDGVVFTGRFIPEASLVHAGGLAVDGGSRGPAVDEFGRTADPAVFAAGNLLRPVETAGWSWREGRRAAEAIAADLAGTLPAAAPAAAVAILSDALAYAVPQRIAGREPVRVQFRAARPVRGVLRARQGGRVLAERRLAALPERRILLGLSGVAPDGPAIGIDIEE